VKLLLSQEEVNPKARDYHSRTPLMYAAKRGHDGIVELLQGRSDAESDTEADYLCMSASSSESSGGW